MDNFEGWYKAKFPDLDPELDDIYGYLKEAYEVGWNDGLDYCEEQA